MSKKTYRCDEVLSNRIEALSGLTGWSFQRITDEFYKRLLYKLQTESVYFRELTITKQVEHVVDEFVAIPSIKGFYNQKRF